MGTIMVSHVVFIDEGYKLMIKSLYNHIVIHRWDLGFVLSSMDEVLGGEKLHVERVKNRYKSRWFADPFILSYDDNEIVLLVEDYWDSDCLGRISKLVIDRHTYEIKDVKVILQLDSHLSFPAIMRVEGKIYIYPENSREGGLWLYEYNLQTDECKKIDQLSDQPLADAIITNTFGKKQIFSTKEPNPNKNILDIYDWNDKRKSFEHSESVTFNENIARNAGDFFEYKGTVYRPAQECNGMYGHAVSIQKVEKSGNNYLFTEVRRIMSPKGAFGIHTFNTYNGLTVIDMKVFRHPWIAKPLFALRNWLSFAIKHK